MKPVIIKTKLRSNTLKIANSGKLLGKEVEITIKEVEKVKSKKRNWKHSGSIDLKGKADKINLRDLAYQ
jgi:hypothetical protein